MKRFIQGHHRGQSTPLPKSLDDYVSDTNPVLRWWPCLSSGDLKSDFFNRINPLLTLAGLHLARSCDSKLSTNPEAI